MRILGLDVGTKRVGIAISDESGILAQGRGYIERKKDADLVSELKKIVNEENIVKVVVGLPVNMDGSEGERALDSRSLASLIGKDLNITTVFWDERLSTKEAEDIMLKADISRKKRKRVIDKMAAQIILQGYLDSRE